MDGRGGKGEVEGMAEKDEEMKAGKAMASERKGGRQRVRHYRSRR